MKFTISPELEATVKDLVAKNPRNKKTILTQLEKVSEDFERIENLGTSRRVFFSKKLGVVVKRPYLTGRKLTKRQAKYLIPTLTFTNSKGRCPWFVQPLCTATEKAGDRAYRFFSARESLSFGDLHEGNVGYYRGKPVIFDY